MSIAAFLTVATLTSEPHYFQKSARDAQRGRFLASHSRVRRVRRLRWLKDSPLCDSERYSSGTDCYLSPKTSISTWKTSPPCVVLGFMCLALALSFPEKVAITPRPRSQTRPQTRRPTPLLFLELPARKTRRHSTHVRLRLKKSAARPAGS